MALEHRYLLPSTHTWALVRATLSIYVSIVVADECRAECSRRDDLESLAYMLVYFLKGTLPWRRVKGKDITATWDLIRDKKLEVESVLTVGLPAEFEILFKYARGLEFDDLPDYNGLRALFRSLAERQGIVYDDVYDWTIGKSKSKRRFCEACNARR